jgi:hypothetical protein
MDAAMRLAAKFGGISRAQQAIAIALREGLLRARAGTCAYIDEDERVVQDEATPEEPIEISADVWHWSDNWPADVMRWSWDEGWFDVRAHDAEQDRTFIGVTFSDQDLERLDPSLPAFTSLQAPRPVAGAKRGPKTNVNKWGALIGALLELERANRLKVEDHVTTASLLNAVRQQIPDTNLWLDERTMEGVLAYVWRYHLEELPTPNERN